MSVVVASRGRRHLLGPLVAAVCADSATSELFVVLDGDVDHSLEFLKTLQPRYPRLSPILRSGGGQHAALDEGIRRSRSEVILLLDDDVLPGPGLVAGHARHHVGRANVVVVGYMPVRLSEDRTSAGAVIYAADYEGHCSGFEHAQQEVLDGLWLGNVSIRRNDALHVGMRSEVYSGHYHSDQEFGLRLQSAGMRGIFDRTLHATHLHHRSNRSFLRDARERGHALPLLHSLYPDRLGPFDRDATDLDLPRPIRRAVHVVGRTPWAPALSYAVMGCGTVVGRAGLTRVELGAAKLARRVMIRRGIESAESRGRTSSRARW